MEWEVREEKLEKEFVFENFTQAVAFVNKIVPLANVADHHPDVLLHSYKRVKVSMHTHSEGKITQKDYDLAEKIDGINH